MMVMMSPVCMMVVDMIFDLNYTIQSLCKYWVVAINMTTEYINIKETENLQKSGAIISLSIVTWLKLKFCGSFVDRLIVCLFVSLENFQNDFHS